MMEALNCRPLGAPVCAPTLRPCPPCTSLSLSQHKTQPVSSPRRPRNPNSISLHPPPPAAPPRKLLQAAAPAPTPAPGAMGANMTGPMMMGANVTGPAAGGANATGAGAGASPSPAEPMAGPLRRWAGQAKSVGLGCWGSAYGHARQPTQAVFLFSTAPPAPYRAAHN
jgi:hypothetical protein